MSPRKIGPCEVHDCPKSGPGSLCHKHRSRLDRHGTTGGGPTNHGTLAERYERFVVRKPDGCWGWTGKVGSTGYPDLTPGRGHRTAYELFVGPIPDGLYVLHRCDNPPCTNPSHLMLGTHADNMADAARKGRLGTKLNVEQVRKIRALGAAGAGHLQLAVRFDVTKDTIRRILRRETWSRV